MHHRIDRTRPKQTELHRCLQTCLDQREPVLLVDLAPRLGPQHGRTVNEDDLPNCRVDRRPKECINTEAHALQGIRRSVRCDDNGFDKLSLYLLEDRAEHVALRPEMVVQRAFGNAGALHDVVDGRSRVALSREQLPGDGQQLPPCRLGSLSLSS